MPHPEGFDTVAGIHQFEELLGGYRLDGGATGL